MWRRQRRRAAIIVFFAKSNPLVKLIIVRR
jgi:hypothetical protein